MKKFTFKSLIALILIVALSSTKLSAQALVLVPPAAGAPSLIPATCVDGGAVLPPSVCSLTDFSARFIRGTRFGTSGGTNGLLQGGVWRFGNINQSTFALNRVNATITVDTIYQAVLDNIDDSTAANEGGNITDETRNWFAPRIAPDGTGLGNTARFGFVQFTINFFQESDSTNGPLNYEYLVPKALLGINYSHRDIDGTRITSGNTAQAYFRETGLVKNTSGTAVASINASVNTELTAYNYTTGGTNWVGFAGSTCDRNNISRYQEVAASFIYAAAPQTSITVRMGYDWRRVTATGGTFGNGARQYASEFRCFSFPTIVVISLPVKYSFFNAKREGNDVKLSWQTATETNNLGFQIERRIATGEWKNIGFSAAKSAHGNSSTPINYEFTDANNTAKGVIQYRLKQMDFDMRSAYSDIRAVRGMGLKGGLLIYPNPSTDGKVNIVFEDNKSSVDVSLSDMNGRTIKQWRKVTSSALQINNLTPGMYTLRIVNAQSGEQTVEKIMVNNR